MNLGSRLVLRFSLGLIGVAAMLFLTAGSLKFWVLKVNSFASRTIQVEAGQKVVSSGPYGIVRHPMYLGAVIMCLSAPLALGSSRCLPLP